MQIININNRNVYALTASDIKGMDSEPDCFQKVWESWEEGDKKSELSEQEIKQLKKKYNSNSMTDEETTDLLGQLVQSGLLSKDMAKNIFYGVVPLSPEELSNTEGFLRPATAADDFNGVEGFNHQKDFDYFQSIFGQVSQSSDKEYISGYKAYMFVLDQLRHDKILA